MVAPAFNEFTQLRQFAGELADAAGAAVLPYFRTTLNIHDKGIVQYDPVTEADKAGERAMRELIMARYPEHGILGEEEPPINSRCDFTWVLDPIDGTRAFVTGLPTWGTLIALNDGRRPVIGVMDQPFTHERFIGTAQGTSCNGKILKTSPCSDLTSARVMCTSPYMFNDARQRQAFEHIAADARLVRFGGDCYAYCMLAAGHVDVVIEADLKHYDVQALIPIVEGAGGVITTWSGGDAQHGGAVIACGDAGLHSDLLDRLQAFHSHPFL